LIVKLSALGDVVQALPVAVALKRQAPEAVVEWLVERPYAPLLASHPAVDRVIESPRHEIWEGSGSMLTAVSGFGRALRRHRYQAVLDLQGLMKSAIFVALCRAERKIGFKGGKEPLAAWPLTERLDPYDPERHALERYLDLLEPLGLMRPATPEFGLEPGEQARARARELTGGGEGPLVVLHPVAKWESKLWPAAHWAELAAGLAARGARLAFTGAKGDRAHIRAILRRSGAPGANLAGATSLPELAAVLGRARAVVSTDTGAMHLAAATGAPVVALFGPTAPWRTGPYGRNHRVLRLGLDCSPCFRRECERPICLTGLTPEMVLGETVPLLERDRP
jgi:heptosyltransferase-1